MRYDIGIWQQITSKAFSSYNRTDQKYYFFYHFSFYLLRLKVIRVDVYCANRSQLYSWVAHFVLSEVSQPMQGMKRVINWIKYNEDYNHRIGSLCFL